MVLIVNQFVIISIHALREEGDHRSAAHHGTRCTFLSTPSARRATTRFLRIRQAACISIHALREEGDTLSSDWIKEGTEFLSTPSARRATRCWQTWANRQYYFYPRPPRGGRRSTSYQRGVKDLISIHALREEGDRDEIAFVHRGKQDFYPRPPRGGRPCPAWPRFCEYCYFYPRPPRGGRPIYVINVLDPSEDFYPRPPRGGRHGRKEAPAQAEKISIHALREEGDPTRARHAS